MPEWLWHNIVFPVLVIQIFVAFGDACPSEICTCTGSSGSFSLDQKYTEYGPILSSCGIQYSSVFRKLQHQMCIIPYKFSIIRHLSL